MKRRFSPFNSTSKVAILLVFMNVDCAAETETGTFPAGWLSIATKSIVIGTRPTLEWEVLPSSIQSQVAIAESGRITLLRDAVMSVRVIGVAPRDRDSSVEVRIQIAGGGYSPIFLDSRQRGTPDKLALERSVSTGQTIDIGARVRNGEGEWANWYSSTNSNRHVVALKNGDPAPPPTESAPRKYLLPYLDSNNKIRIGSTDLLLLIEASASDPEDSSFDLQDAAVLVSFNGIFPK